MDKKDNNKLNYTNKICMLHNESKTIKLMNLIDFIYGKIKIGETNEFCKEYDLDFMNLIYKGYYLNGKKWKM